MKRRYFFKLAAGSSLLTNCQSEEPINQVDFTAMGIECSIQYRSANKMNVSKILELISTFESSISLWDESSELRRLNQDSLLANPSSLLLDLLKKARELHLASSGLFDPSIHSYLEWLRVAHQSGQAPEPSQIQEKRELVDFSKVEVSPGRIRLPHGMKLSLNAIGQGALTDAVAEAFADYSYPALVNFGEYRVVGSEAWPVEIEEETMPLTRALAVSSGHRDRLSASSDANHLIHPKSGESPPPKKVFAVIADEAWLADGLATIVALGGDVPKQYFSGVEVHQF